MRAPIERWLMQRWYGGAVPGLGLRALAGAYRALQQAQRVPVVERIPVPVIVIGNFTAGGTGKTPLTIALAKHFSGKGVRPGVVSRGHGRHSTSPVRVSPETPAEQCGDEPKLIFEKTGLPVFVDRDRVAAAQAAVAAGCNLVIADDGLQHRRLGRDIEIEMVDGERGYGNGLFLPAGPLREAPRKCDFRVVAGEGAGGTDWPMQLQMTDAVSLRNSGARRALSRFLGEPVHAVAGIGNPGRFFQQLRQVGLELVEHDFEDHHSYRADDFSEMTGAVLMTEKDAVKCRGLELEEAWAVPVEAMLPAAFFVAIDAKLKEVHVGT